MKKIINILSIIAAILTSIFVICTFVTSYHFWYVGIMFNTYMSIQISLAVTMLLLGIKFLLNETGKKRVIYSIISICISGFLIISIQLIK